MTDDLTSFEHDLLSQLTRRVTTRERARRRRRVGFGLSGGVAAAVVGVLAFTMVASPAPAYAVDQTDSGAIVVTIAQLSDESGLEQKLADYGIEADVAYDLTPASSTEASTGAPVEGVTGSSGSGVSEGTAVEATPGTGVVVTEGVETPGVQTAEPCSLPADAAPTVERLASGVRITLPASWTALDEPLAITTSSGTGFDGLRVSFGENCAVETMSTAPLD